MERSVTDARKVGKCAPLARTTTLQLSRGHCWHVCQGGHGRGFFWTESKYKKGTYGSRLRLLGLDVEAAVELLSDTAKFVQVSFRNVYAARSTTGGLCRAIRDQCHGRR